jgi:hypothetical protein
MGEGVEFERELRPPADIHVRARRCACLRSPACSAPRPLTGRLRYGETLGAWGRGSKLRHGSPALESM